MIGSGARFLSSYSTASSKSTSTTSPPLLEQAAAARDGELKIVKSEAPRRHGAAVCGRTRPRRKL
jgi:hypothetical protein